MRIAAGITLYNPDIARLQENLNRIAPQVDAVFAVDNGSDNKNEFRALFEALPNARLYENERNLGIAAALNQLSRTALDEGFDWLLTLDQDTVAAPDLIEQYRRFTDRRGVAILTPRIQDQFEPERIESEAGPPCEPVTRCYTSASLTLLSAWEAVGGYDERLFIDCVDFDYCTTLIEHGYTLLRINSARVSHILGHAKEVRFFMPLGRFLHLQKLKKPFFTYNHSPLRTYYYARNIKYYTYKHRKSIRRFTEWRVYLQWLVLKLGFEDQKWEKLKAIVRGRIDGGKMIRSLKKEQRRVSA